ncbi:MAG TPA: FmdB family zinc ribbon protein, partial [Nitrospira sp.]|nr:FmdB family zinc ribbon protein [Nitrospira sp.]
MPIYEYQCDSCGYQFEVKQSIKDAALTTCERCGKSLRRLISSPGIMFKGSGWYVTDYSNKLKPPSEGEKTPTPAAEKKEAPAGSSAAPASAPAPPSGSPSNSTSSSPPPAANSSPT